jgi:hypothetical protein
MSRNKVLPRPTEAVWNKKVELEELEATDDLMGLMNEYDWSNEMFEEEGRFGLKSCMGDILLPAKFDGLKLLSSQNLPKGAKVVACKDNKWGIVKADGFGEWCIQPEFDDIGFPNYFTAVRKGDKWGILNTELNEWVVELEMDEICNGSSFPFINGVAYFMKDGKMGVMTDRGYCTDPVFDEVMADDSGLITATCNGQTGFINREGELITDPDEAWFMESEI